MTRWEYFLTADRKHDLADVHRAREWAMGDWWQQVGERKTEALKGEEQPAAFAFSMTPNRTRPLEGTRLMAYEPTAADAAEWKAAVSALRSIAARVEKFGGRAAEIDAKEADKIMARYLGGLRLHLRTVGPPMTEVIVRLRPGGTANDFAGIASHFWQQMFVSFVKGYGEPVCRDCGKAIGLTKKGRMRWAQRCPECSVRHRDESISIEQKRKNERDKKRRQRAKKKSSTKKGK